MKSEHDPSLVFDEQAIDDTDTEEVRVQRTPQGGFSMRRGAGAPIQQVMETLELGLAQDYTITMQKEAS